jgi:mRNA interferase MazF
MTICEPGDIVLVRFPFTDLTSAKKRPAVVISPPEFPLRHGDFLVIALTSQPQKSAIEVHRWSESGLPRKTWLKPILATLSQDVIQRKLGQLHRDDFPGVMQTLSVMIAGEFWLPR